MAEGATTDVFEVIHTMRAMRRLKPDPVPDELIRKILLAGQAAPSGGNTQRWRFLVIKDTEIKKKVQVHYKRAFDEVVGPRYLNSPAPPGQSARRAAGSASPVARSSRRGVPSCRGRSQSTSHG